MNTQKQTQVKGGSFILESHSSATTFTPEEFSEEQVMLRQSVTDFIQKEIEPNYAELDSAKAHQYADGLMKKVADLGFLSLGVEEQYGGYEADFTTQVALTEMTAQAYSFGLTIGVQTSIGIAPILFYGNEEQKQKYLPGLVSAEIKSCYCLTEPQSGSDANAARTKAVWDESKQQYMLNGQKMWITNSGYADIFIVFAKIEDDDLLSAFIVEKAFGGITLGEEEKKMGIKGSSTRQVFFNDVPIPAENLLGERQRGFKMALEVLNTGRIKMGASVMGIAKRAIKHGIDYAAERKQFGQSLNQFGAIQHKIGQMGALIYAMESMTYRASNDIDQKFDELIADGLEEAKAKYLSVADFAVECSLIKVYNTEAFDFIVDESLQIHGGMGFSSESKIETLYRDSRVNRIYEGTNEINRMLSVDMIFRKAMKGELDLMTAVQQAMAQKPHEISANKLIIPELYKVVENLKVLMLQLAGQVAEKFATTLSDEQEVTMALSDMMMQIYALESAIMRAEKNKDDKMTISFRIPACQILAFDAVRKCRIAAEEICLTLSKEPNTYDVYGFLNLPVFPLKDLRRELAQVMISNEGYFFSK
ncbi:acyl-CoA dehydrogenase family protein [Sediminitomix flava]|uniref:Alkylation response protein AidB-like acyl-CoA dehydrogenase n=1 Tax=Sediminitomix flava TaxID=379075 RepID=A0A315ZGS2_SEDFL|nr:acyl-CoA dehydrogenase family protein [Sediminitomix flava]PWJ43934.1 alkylation response protein AidB-like acyl-CoA dehydrogenase [Sediminitomix flava]